MLGYFIYQNDASVVKDFTEKKYPNDKNPKKLKLF